jgi:hypothetical protein
MFIHVESGMEVAFASRAFAEIAAAGSIGNLIKQIARANVASDFIIPYDNVGGGGQLEAVGGACSLGQLRRRKMDCQYAAKEQGSKWAEFTWVPRGEEMVWKLSSTLP